MGEVRMKAIQAKDSLACIVNPQLVASGDENKRPVVSVLTLVDIWKRNKGAIAEWAAIAYSMKEKGNIPRASSIAALCFQLAKKHEMEAKLFCDYLTTGAGMKAGDPVLVLRNRLHDESRAARKLDVLTIAAYVVKAWVAWNEGRSIGILRWSGSGPRAEAFPSHIFKVDS
jgi:hypothetical protein